MLRLKSFIFNPFAENTYLVWDENSLECTIFDPGCSDFEEEQIIENFIKENQLKPVQLINTHCHIDHVLGNLHFCEKYNLKLKAHNLETSILEWSQSSAMMFQIPYNPYPHIDIQIDEADTITIGNHQLEIRLTPGHSPGSLTFVCHEFEWALVGDVIFYQSIGRTDLPSGNFQILEESIRKKIYSLPDNYTLFSGHGQQTTVGYEKRYNGFVREG
ncbi:MAG: MBL fold metallo-hydrolase [Bacteroidetes bacterium]|nr:MBL fold metallo-hydrolase [Bacteroidota bacterium]